MKTFDVPMRDLGFLGSPAKEMVTIMPCSDCLIAVVEKPVRGWLKGRGWGRTSVV